MAFLYLLLLVGINYTAPISEFHCNFLLCAFICVWIAPNYFSSALLQPAFGCLKTSKLWSKVLLRFFVHSSSMGPKSLRSQIWFLNPLDLFFDGTGRNRTGRDGTSNCPYVPGERNFLLPVPFLQGQGQEQKSHYKYLLIWFNWKLFRENDQISCFKTSFSYFRTSFSALFRFVPWDRTGQLSKSCTIPSRILSWILTGCPGPSLCPGTTKELLSLCPEKLHCPFSLETLIWIKYFLEANSQKQP